jgi:perosamine synthetase
MCSNALTPNTKALILTHTFGVPVEITKYRELGINIIEDCCQSIGSKYMGKNVGLEGDLAVFSFYATKMITTGQGGMIVSSNKNLIDKVRDFRDFDGCKDYYPRFNFQITDFQASLGISQLRRLPIFVSKRKRNSQIYIDAIGSHAYDLMQLGSDQAYNNGYRFILKVGSKMKEYIEIFAQNGVTCVSPILNHELLHRYLNLQPNQFSCAEEISKSALSIPIYPALTDQQITKISDVLSNLYM